MESSLLLSEKDVSNYIFKYILSSRKKMSNKVIRATVANDTIRVFVAITTDMVQKAKETHNASPLAIAALGRTMTAASIMGLMMKGEKDKLTVQLKGSGPLGSVVVTADNKGIVKGYVDYPQVDLPLREDGKIDVSAGIGLPGKITVIKDLGLKEPYIGTNELYNGEVAEDLVTYFAYSEQQPSAVGLGVLVNPEYGVLVSGGFIVQVMPDAQEEDIQILEKNISKIKSVTDLLIDKKNPEEIASSLLEDFKLKILQENEVDFICDCSKEKISKVLVTIGKKDMKEIIEKDEKAEIVCHFCNKKYNFTKTELEEIFKQM